MTKKSWWWCQSGRPCVKVPDVWSKVGDEFLIRFSGFLSAFNNATSDIGHFSTSSHTNHFRIKIWENLFWFIFSGYFHISNFLFSLDLYKYGLVSVRQNDVGPNLKRVENGPSVMTTRFQTGRQNEKKYQKA